MWPIYTDSYKTTNVFYWVTITVSSESSIISLCHGFVAFRLVGMRCVLDCVAQTTHMFINYL